MIATHYPELLSNLLEERGIKKEDTEDFLNPDYEKLYDPMLLFDMEKARERVIRAMKEGEHIMVFSDYDADGIPGAVVMNDFFKKTKYRNASFYIPHRHDEGLGLNIDAIDEAKKRGAKLIITVDCGIADLEEVSHANSLDIDVLITDHHEPGEVLPEAYAIINPKLPDSAYPFKELCGSAVAFKLIQAILLKENFGLKTGTEKWSLDMVGIATLSDCVPLLGENRILATFGLRVLKKSPRPGLLALLKKLGTDQRYLSEDDIAFMITPRINAASRMGVPMDAFSLLSAESPLEAERLALHLEKINNERKGVVAAMVKEAKKHLDGRALKDVIVIGNPEWRPSLLGLVANSLVEEYKRPAFVWGRDGDGTLKGSCRSYNGTDLFELMTKAKESFIQFGGHKGAGGFSVTLEKIATLEDELSSCLVQDENEREGENEEGGVSVSLSDIGEKLHETLSLLAPFGTGNPKPVFQIEDAHIKSVRTFGKTGDHLEVILENGKGKEVKGISFFSTPESFGAPLSPGAKPKVKAHLEKSYFRNRPEIRLRIVDIQ